MVFLCGSAYIGSNAQITKEFQFHYGELSDELFHMRYILLLTLLHYSFHLLAQKKPLDHSTPNIWPFVKDAQLSNDGKFFLYNIETRKDGPSLIIQSTINSWRKKIAQAHTAIFTEDNRRVIFQNSNDSLGILDLAKDTISYMEEISSYKTPEDGNGQWMACLKKKKKELITCDLHSGQKTTHLNVIDYAFSKNGHALIINEEATKDSIQSMLSWVNLADGSVFNISKGYTVKSIIFDSSAEQLAFLKIDKSSGSQASSIMYYHKGMDNAIALVDSLTIGMDELALANGDLHFSDGGDKLFFPLKPRNDHEIRKKKDARVEIFSYNNEKALLNNSKGPFLAVVNIGRPGSVIRLLRAEDNGARSFSKGNDQKYLLASGNLIGGNYGDSRWFNPENRPDINLISTTTGSRVLIKKRLIGSGPYFSTTGKYVIWFDLEKSAWFSYNIANKVAKIISTGITVPLNNKSNPNGFTDIAGWTKDDQEVLIYDFHDLWKVDPDAVKPPVNITNGYGRRNNLCLRLVNFNTGNSEPINPSDSLLLSAFNVRTKNSGFFKLTFDNKNSRLTPLIMEARANFPSWPRSTPEFPNASHPVFLKAKHSDSYVITRMSASDYPNYYLTTNFVTFKPLTNLEPQLQFNWYTTELIHWNLLDGNLADGILFKPENFDPSKKYPLIVYIYDQCSDALNTFIQPEWSSGCMDIPWFASNGYIVFVPDIKYKKGFPGYSAYDAVVSGTRHVAKNPWVDSRHIGLQGHSFGGFETNYIVTRTSLFAAAAPASAVSDIVSEYGLIRDKKRYQGYYESGQGGIGASLWGRPDLYIQNSPVFRADKVTTPLLIMHNPEDYLVPISQGEEWYSALRRLNKKVWMLSYKGEEHSISDETLQLDYSIRLGEFFGHFLKGAKAPTWMEE